MSTEFTYAIDARVAVVTMNDPLAPVNNWSESSELQFEAVMDELDGIAKRGDIKGVVFTSGKPDTFLTGADLNELKKTSTREGFSENVKLLQRVLGRCSKLSVPTLAAINGPCMGGGYELALACSYRVATDAPRTQIGLPETGLGLIPAGGGTTRLPRLIGYPGVEAILSGKNFGVKAALEIGMIDRIVPAEGDLAAYAKTFLDDILSGKVEIKRKVHDFSQAREAVKEIGAEFRKKNRGRLLPAHEAVLKTVAEGVNLPLEEQLDLEREYFLDAAMSNECKGLIHTFFLRGGSSPKKMMTKGFVPKEIRKVAVLGFGSMGRGIAMECLKYLKVPVVVKDVEKALQPGREFLEKIIGGDIEKRRYKGDLAEVMKNLITVSDYTDDFKDVDIVIEAVFEEKGVKAQVYKELAEVIPIDAIVASNTSFLSIDELQKEIQNPERFAGMHYFSPVWRMELVEIIRGKDTSREAIDNLLHFAGGIRKRPILCNDSSGFVVNAVLDPLMTNGLGLVEQGNPVEKVDGAMLKFGMPIGPIRLADEVGLDVSYHIFKTRGIEQKTYENLFNDGRYGLKKSGKGLFLPDGSVDPDALQCIAYREKKEMSEEEIADFFVTEMVKVGKRLLDEGIVEDPRVIDVGLIWGAGFPTDKGGPMKWADLSGISEKLFAKKIYMD